ncbi:hypothetical protein CAEBREN_08227 [Caenorhabditis brenneri]|uniref:Uncharacterized protein n=1 Tax=Caenorhabditis brenneri TaxID=135651 RepID=G0MJ27_CAEBE|nr:hypothetical protein CAEBREN_08227 [Caenorhabditis brenneri]
MNLQSIQILSIAIGVSYSLHNPSSPRLLTPGENLERLKSCGRNYADTDEKKWFWVAQSGDLTMFANRISKRHFITFSSLLVARHDQWMNTEETINRVCDDGINLRVPPKQLSYLRIVTSDCFSVNPKDHINCLVAIPVNAWIPHFCESEPEDRTPMIIEVAEDMSKSNGIMCVAGDDAHSVRRFSWAQMYVLRDEDGLNKWNVQIMSISQESYFISNNDIFTDNSDYSGLLFQSVNGAKHLIGYRDSRSEDPLQFHRLSWFSDEICKLTGICEPKKQPQVTLEVPSIIESTESMELEETTPGYSEVPSTVSAEPLSSTSMQTTTPGVPSEEPEAMQTTTGGSEVFSTVPGPPTSELKTTVPPVTSTTGANETEALQTGVSEGSKTYTVPTVKTTVLPVRTTVTPSTCSPRGPENPSHRIPRSQCMTMRNMKINRLGRMRKWIILDIGHKSMWLAEEVWLED